MPDDMADYRRIREEELEPIRREAGFDPEEPDYTGETVNRYIELLEARVVGHRAALSTLSAGMRGRSV